MRAKFLTLLLLALASLQAQDQTASQTAVLEKILARLQALEEQNHQLTDEIRQLRQQLEASRSTQSASPALPPTSAPL